MNLLKILWEEWLQLSFEEWLLPGVHHGLNFLDVVLHLLDKLVLVSDHCHCLVDEWVNAMRVPHESLNTSLQRVVHLLDSLSKKWLLNWEENRKNLVVHVGDDLEVSSLSSVHINFLVKEMSSLWHLDVHEEEILDLSKDPHEHWVEVNSDESLWSLWSCFSIEEELLEVVLSGLFDSLLPKLNLAEVVVLQVLA